MTRHLQPTSAIAFTTIFYISWLPSKNKLFSDLDGGMPGVLRFGKRENGVEKKEVPGVLRFGKRTNKKSMPGIYKPENRDFST
ncbi:unnamed protein product [Haemonchus placei]|uniref:Uncharacterized protein n=1 Tax=Haemonchus placei TaxID=6290 RepID=A0A3P7UJW8_HAEPC|nr:unnamed protein product [Haemonchus placei]